MIKAIEGVISKKEPTYVWLKTGGVSYGVGVSILTASRLNLGDKVELFITQIIREDADLLFGFLENSEQKIFEMLLKVSGIGASTAMAVCSSLSPNQVASAVANGDMETFKKVPGIGPKTAKMLIATLSDAEFSQNLGGAKSEAFLALESLGFKKDLIAQILSSCVSSDTSELVKEALKKINQKGQK